MRVPHWRGRADTVGVVVFFNNFSKGGIPRRDGEWGAGNAQVARKKGLKTVTI